MALDRGILLDLVITSSTYSTKRNEEEQHSSYDITGNDNFSQQNFTLAANNSNLNNLDSIKNIGPVESFLYIYAPYKAKITLIKGIEQINIDLVNVLVLSTALDSVLIKNNSQTQPLSIKVIVS